MPDLLQTCNSGEMQTDPQVFKSTWCSRCHNPHCARSQPLTLAKGLALPRSKADDPTEDGDA